MSKGNSFFILGGVLGVIATSLLFTVILYNQDDAEVADQGRVLRLGHNLSVKHPLHQSLLYFSEELSNVSGNQLKLEVYPASQLGDETKCIEQVQSGTLDFTKTSTGPLGNFVGLMKLFSLPYLFRDSGHYWQVLEGEIGQELLSKLSVRDGGGASGIHGLGYFDSGSRNFYSNVPIHSPKDLQGRKFRVMRDPVAMDLVSALGGSPTPIPFGELYTALKQGVVDGAENNPSSVLSARHHEVAKYLSLDAHTRIPDLVIMSQKTWNKLSDQEKAWLEASMLKATSYQRELWKVSEEKSLAQIKKEGVEVIEVDQAPFKLAVKPVIEKYAQGELLEFYNRIQAVK